MMSKGAATRILVTLVSIAALGWCCASAAMADGTLLSGSITDQLIDTSKMYSIGSLFVNGAAALPYDPLDLTGGQGEVQRGGSSGYQFMEYKAAAGKQITHVKVSWMILNTSNPYDGTVQLFDGADQNLNAADAVVFTDPDGWRWHITEADLSTASLTDVRVGFVYGYDWEPQIGTVKVDVAVPEPGSLLALAAGVISLIGMRRRRS